MHGFTKLRAALGAGKYNPTLERLYGRENLNRAWARAVRAADGLERTFAPAETARAALFSGPGRTELGGNHTDHQHGRVLCGSVDLDMLACAAPNGLPLVRIRSEGYPELEVSLDELSVKSEESGTSAALVRGVAAKLTEQGFRLSGFDACVSSTVLSGSGLSSSAAYEVLIGNIFNHFSCDHRLDAVEIAKIGQYAENVYFGKPCGLMDQVASSVGGAVSVDFDDPAAPVVKRIDYEFSGCGHALCIIDTVSSHDDLTEDYAAIPREMRAVAAYFGKEFLRDVPESEVRAQLPALRAHCGDRAVLRALHYYADDRRAAQEAEALEADDFARFLALVNASGLSSELLLQNIWCASHPERQAVSLALELGRELLDGAGAIRVHGGGFAGTIQAFVPNEKVGDFRSGIEAVLGEGTCHIVHIRPVGGCVITE